MMIGSDATNSGLYGWGSGTSGGRGDGTYNFNGGTLAGGGSMIVRYDAPATGTFQGQGCRTDRHVDQQRPHDCRRRPARPVEL